MRGKARATESWLVEIVAKIFGPITSQCKAKPLQFRTTFDTQLKSTRDLFCIDSSRIIRGGGEGGLFWSLCIRQIGLVICISSREELYLLAFAHQLQLYSTAMERREFWVPQILNNKSNSYRGWKLYQDFKESKVMKPSSLRRISIILCTETVR